MSLADIEEIPLAFSVHGARLYGIASVPQSPARQGVLIVVGGPQYRIGSHRQFVLLARHLAPSGIAAMRFDYRGMGDSEGEPVDFLSAADDIKGAIDAFMTGVPSLESVALWGLCDAATAASLYAPLDQRVNGLVLVNPWVRSETSAAQTYLRHYYAKRLFEKEFWRKAVSGKIAWAGAAQSFARILGASLDRSSSAKRPGAQTSAEPKAQTLGEKMLDALNRFEGKFLIILSGNDLTAREFSLLVDQTQSWQALLTSRNIPCHELPEANHTFAASDWRTQVSHWTSRWIKTEL